MIDDLSQQLRPALVNRTIWLTRPAGQIAELAQALQDLGARVFAFPLMIICPRMPTAADKQRLLNLDQYDLVFFVSTNAARMGLDVIAGYWPQYPAHILNFAVGPSTAAEIAGYGLTVCYPQDRTDSEGMLELPQLQHISGKKALIVRGVGGREIMAQELLARGASVDYAQLYERLLPVYTHEQLYSYVQQQTPDAVVISSAEAVDNLRQLYEPLQNDALRWQEFPLFVASSRLAAHAHAQGFSSVITMAGATDAAIINGLMTAFKK